EAVDSGEGAEKLDDEDEPEADDCDDY
ncbi:unnamed protein product, partial [Didymodactylos carnosus]